MVDELSWRVRKVLCTHHHADQIGGNLDVKRTYHCEVIGPRAEAGSIPGMTTEVGEGDKVILGDAEAIVMDLPGHTAGHVGYWFKTADVLFCGDVLYPMGCGRVFEGSPAQMWQSLLKIRALPPDTKIYCAHEYGERNYRFARSIDKENAQLQARGDGFRNLQQSGGIGVPFTLADDVATNPFLRADDPAIQKAIGMAGKNPIDVFTELRRRHDET